METWHIKKFFFIDIPVKADIWACFSCLISSFIKKSCFFIKTYLLGKGGRMLEREMIIYSNHRQQLLTMVQVKSSYPIWRVTSSPLQFFFRYKKNYSSHIRTEVLLGLCKACTVCSRNVRDLMQLPSTYRLFAWCLTNATWAVPL